MVVNVSNTRSITEVIPQPIKVYSERLITYFQFCTLINYVHLFNEKELIITMFYGMNFGGNELK